MTASSLAPEGTTPKTQSLKESQYFCFQDEHQRRWWEQTAPLLTRILISAQYDLHQQQLYMVLYRSLVVPLLGPQPHQWDSFITYCGLPVEFSINYKDNGLPTARIGWEPVSHLSGTTKDAFNLHTVNKAVLTLSKLQLKSFDTRLFTHFLNTLTVSQEQADTIDVAQLPISRFKNQASFGLDLKGGDVTVKCYIYPALKGYVTGQTFQQLIEDAVYSGKALMPYPEALPAVHEYMENAGFYNQYSFLGFDFINPANSRLKIYATAQEVTWEKIESIWTVGGRFSEDLNIQRGLGFARELWLQLTGDTDHEKKDQMAVGIWNYELTPGSLVPMPKWYFILHGQNDMENAQAVASFYQCLGWIELAESFIPTFQSYLYVIHTPLEQES
ncbi:Brevianamide F reverse prenyltransferase [Penicillium rolfsii]|nr:Brevianamide F reverse prenyltransferase [Penicillium rolfsii]